MALRLNGTAIADFLLWVGGVCVNYTDMPCLAAALKWVREAISDYLFFATHCGKRLR